MDDFTKSMAFEVKKEIADRYFGFRKVIEQDSNEYQKEIITSTLILERRIGFDLLRIYALLQEDELINQFYEITKLGDVLFFDSYISKSPSIRKRLFAEQRVHGFFRKWRFRNMFFDVYESLRLHVEDYRKRIASLIEEHDIIEEEIKLFYQKNDISGIMLFLRSLESDSDSSETAMGGPASGKGAISMEEKMRLRPPQPVEKFLPILPPVPPKAEVKHELYDLINRAYALQPDLDLKNL